MGGSVGTSPGCRFVIHFRKTFRQHRWLGESKYWCFTGFGCFDSGAKSTTLGTCAISSFFGEFSTVLCVWWVFFMVGSGSYCKYLVHRITILGGAVVVFLLSVFQSYMVSGDGRTPLFPESMEFCFYLYIYIFVSSEMLQFSFTGISFLVIHKSQVTLIWFTSIQLDLFYIWGCLKIKD